MSSSGKHSRFAPGKDRPVKWRRLALTALAAGVAGASFYVFFPGTPGSPVADQLSPGVRPSAASAGLLGQGSTYNTDPAPVVTATAKAPMTRPRPVPARSARPAASPVSSAPVTTSGASPADAAGLGIYDGKFGPAGIETAARWLGSSGSIKYAQDFLDATDWSHISNPWQLSNWKGSPFTMVWGVPMLPCGAPATQCAANVSDYNLVAGGGADGYFQTLARHLVSAGFGTSYIRLGWEFNADWMGWGICNPQGTGLSSWAGDFVPAFRNIVTSMRAVTGADFKFIWNPIDSSNASCPGASLENFYPGDSYVDMVSLDTYDGIGGTTGDAARWTDLRNGVNAGGWTAVKPAAASGQSFAGYGMDWLAAFGQQHAKEIGLPEWGLNASGANGGGGDDAYFVTQVAGWIKAHATGPTIFWNTGDGTLPLDIPSYTNGDSPDATAAFKAAFSTAA
ncbi:MAG TPA: glycosyl hydrolase [Trebonia sp.]